MKMAKKIQTFNGDIAFNNAEANEINAKQIIADEVTRNGLVFSLIGSESGYSVAANATLSGKVELPDYHNGLPVLEVGSFAGQTQIAEVKLPSNVLSISASAFSGCTGIVKIELPATVTSIGTLAFSGCTSLLEVKVHGGIATVGANAFLNNATTRKVYVEPALLTAYKASQWVTNSTGLTAADFDVITSGARAQEATKAIADQNGDNIVNTYAKQNGNYLLMTVGGATNAVNAQKTSFSNGSIITIAGGILQTSISLGNKFAELFGTDTEGDFEIQLGTLVGDAALVSFGVVHIDLTASNLPLLSGFAYSDSLGLVLVTATLSVSVDSQTNLPFDLTFSTKVYRFATDAYSNAPAGSLRIRRLK